MDRSFRWNNFTGDNQLDNNQRKQCKLIRKKNRNKYKRKKIIGIGLNSREQISEAELDAVNPVEILLNVLKFLFSYVLVPICHIICKLLSDMLSDRFAQDPKFIEKPETNIIEIYPDQANNPILNSFGSFRYISELPTTSDILCNEEPCLEENITTGKYKSVDHYLHTQFHLLREDFLRPLRENVAKYKKMIYNNASNNKQNKKENIENEIYIYKDVTIQNVILDKSNYLVYQAYFDTIPFKNYDWQVISWSYYLFHTVIMHY